MQLAIFINDLTARVIFGCLLLFLGLGAVFVWKQQRHTQLLLTADGLSHTGWARPLRFQEIQNITGVRQYSNLILTFHMKTKQPPLRKFSLLRFPAKRATLSLSGFDGKPMVIGETIFKYFRRQTGQ